MMQLVPAVPLGLFSLFSVAAVGFALAARDDAARAMICEFARDGWECCLRNELQDALVVCVVGTKKSAS